MSQYRAGTVSVTKGSSTVVGLTTGWTSQIVKGNWFEIQGEGIWYTIAAVVDDTTIVLNQAYNGTTNSKAAYVIQRDFTKYNGYPLVAYGDVDTATLLAYALASIDLQLAQVQPRMTGFINGNVTAAGTMSFSGVTDGDMAVEGNVSMRGVSAGDVEIDGELTLSGEDLLINAGSLSTIDTVVTVAANNATGTAPYAGLKVERGGTDAYWVWDEIHDRFKVLTSIDGLSTSTLGDIQASTIYGTVANPSDTRLKRILGPIMDPLVRLGRLDAVRFLWNDRAFKIGRTGADVGLLAQQVEAVLPEAVVTQHTGDHLKYVQYEKLVPLLVAAVNELSGRLERLEGMASKSCA